MRQDGPCPNFLGGADVAALRFQLGEDQAPVWVGKYKVWETLPVGAPHTRPHLMWCRVEYLPAVHAGNVLYLILKDPFGHVEWFSHGAPRSPRTTPQR